MGTIDLLTKSAGMVVESMRDHPLALALVIMNVALLVIVWLEMAAIFRQQSEINALLSKCVDPDVLRSLGLFK